MSNAAQEAISEKITAVYDALVKEYGQPDWITRRPPLDELVLTILSQHTSDVNAGRAFQQLTRRFRSWEAVAEANPEEIAEAIKSGGLANVKAPRIKEVLLTIAARTGNLDLDFLRSWPDSEARPWLQSLPGVGPKTAACVMVFSLLKPAIPVDTHVYRVSQRLGLIGPKTTADQAHAILESLLKAVQYYTFHINMVTLGRRVCLAQRPRHETCVVCSHCDYVNKG